MFLGIEIGGTKLQLGVGTGDGPAVCRLSTARRRSRRAERPASWQQIERSRPRTFERSPFPGGRLRFRRTDQRPRRHRDDEPSNRRLGQFSAGRMVHANPRRADVPRATTATWPLSPKPVSAAAAENAACFTSPSAQASAGAWSSTARSMAQTGRPSRKSAICDRDSKRSSRARRSSRFRAAAASRPPSAMRSPNSQPTDRDAARLVKLCHGDRAMPHRQDGRRRGRERQSAGPASHGSSLPGPRLGHRPGDHAAWPSRS